MYRIDKEKLCIQEHALFIIICYPLFMVWMPGQCIRLVLNTRFVDDDELESQKEKGPTGLTPGKVLFCSKVDQICYIATVCLPDLGK